MERKDKIEYLKQLAAGKLAPADLLLLLPARTEFFIQRRDGKFNVAGELMTKEELGAYRSGQPGRVHRTLITRRACANATGNGDNESPTLD